MFRQRREDYEGVGLCYRGDVRWWSGVTEGHLGGHLPDGAILWFSIVATITVNPRHIGKLKR